MLCDPLGNIYPFDFQDPDDGAGDRILDIGHHPTLIQETYCVDKKSSIVHIELRKPTPSKVFTKGIA